MTEKPCNSCNAVKPLNEFYTDPTHLDGHHSTCITCNNAASKRYRDANKTKVTAYKQALREREPIKYLLIGAKARCKHLGGHIPFNIQPDDIEHVTHCPVLGVKLEYASSQSKRGMVIDNAASLDRIIPSLGYVKGNVVVISWRANRLKNDASVEEMRAMAKYYASIVESVDNGLLLAV